MCEKNTKAGLVVFHVPVSAKLSYCNGVFVRIGVFVSRVETPLMVLGLSLGFFWFLLPSVSEGVRQIFRDLPFVYAVFDSATKLDSSFIYPLVFLVIYNAFVYQVAMSKGFPGGGVCGKKVEFQQQRKLLIIHFFRAQKVRRLFF